MKITISGEAGGYAPQLAEVLQPACAQGELAVSVTWGGKGLSVSRQGSEACICCETPSALFRAAGYLLQWLSEGTGEASVHEEPAFDHLTYMADCSRNAVPTLSFLRTLIRSLALMGYDRLMLYTEDTYEVPGYPFFGYLRGRYSQDDLRALDSYAQGYGVELVPCIQTLAHLNGIFHWQAFDPVHDTADILCCGREETYELIEAMVRSCAETFHSRVMNIGMDEAEMIGRGAFLRQFGYQERFDIMERHLKRVLAICEKYGFSCMMWSDMFFKLCNNDAYHSESFQISDEMRSRIPGNVEMVYWDYYSRTREQYDRMIRQHHQFTDRVAFAGGAWKWNGFAPLLHHSVEASRLALESCEANGVRNVLVTGWGDNGGEASQACVLPVLSLYAEYQYARRTEEAWVAPRLYACTGARWKDFMQLDSLNLTPDNPAPGGVGVAPAKYLLYQDVLLGQFDLHVDPDTYPPHYAACAAALYAIAEKGGAYAYLFRTLARLADLLAVKSSLGLRLKAAYDAGDKSALACCADSCLEAQKKAAAFHEAVRAQWLRENTPFGLEVLDIRLPGVADRLGRAAERVQQYLDGTVSVLEELEQERLKLDARENPGFRTLPLTSNTWAQIATACPI